MLSPTASAQFSASPSVGGSLALTGSGGSDDCATAEVIAGSGHFTFDNSNATTGGEGQNEAPCFSLASSSIERDVWFSWTSDFDGMASFTTCNTTAVDTKLAVYPGGGCPATGSVLACNDDACGLQSTLDFSVTNGTTYMLQVGTFPGAAGGAGQFFIGDAPITDCTQPFDGNSETSLGLTFGGETLAMVYVDCLSTIDSLEVAFGTPANPGSIPLGSPLTLGIWDDPSNDADPSDATLLHELSIAAGLTSPDLDFLTSYDLQALLGSTVAISGGAFIGVVVAHGANEYPFALDQSSSQLGRNWIGGASASSGAAFDLANLAANDQAPQTLESISFPGHWLLRAGGTQVPSDPGVGFCFCTSGNAPCTNPGAADSGCANGASASGARLSGAGIASVLVDTLVLRATGVAPLQPGLFFQGSSRLAGGAGLAFGDGLRCAGGGIVRLQVGSADASGIITSSGSLAGLGGVAAGELRHYQLWYRDPLGSPCGAGFNLSNGYSVQW